MLRFLLTWGVAGATVGGSAAAAWHAANARLVLVSSSSPPGLPNLPAACSAELFARFSDSSLDQEWKLERDLFKNTTATLSEAGVLLILNLFSDIGEKPSVA